MPAQGTPDSLIFRVNFGACCDMPRLRSTRPVENMPALRLDIAAMIRIAWIAALIQSRPSALNTVTKGLIPGL